MTDIIKKEPEFEQVARFQSLQAGQYWRAQRTIVEEGIDEGTVLLIQSIRWVDDAPHTIILRPHPSKIGQRVYLEIPQDDGSTRRSYFVYDEHRFLLNDFLSAFEFEPDHQRIRSNEVREVQNRINTLQAELLETQSNPVLLANVVEAGLREQAEKAAEKAAAERGDDEDASGERSEAALPVVAPAPGSSIVSLATGTVADAIGTGITSEGIAAMKEAANREHQIATVKAKWIQAKTTEIAETVKAMTPFYEEQAAAALAHTEDVRTYVAKLLQGIESLDLYVGKDVEVQSVREGEAAPKDVPLTFVQRKLLMDEELAVWTDLDEWFDFEKEHLFFEALRKHDGLVNQIFPTERCVLVMAVTRRYIDYGDKWANNARNNENRKVFLLVRNGMNIHRVFSPVESHLGTARLFPTKDDQERIFRGFDGSQIKFEDVAYTDKLEAHERFALHYKRFLLLVCGLDHRLKLFGDFYEGPQSLQFVSMDFQERYCRFLCDDDESTMLPGGDRPSVSKWIDEKNAYLRSGSRVLCNWLEVMNPDTAPGACRRNNDRTSRGFDRNYTPKDRTSVAVAYKEGDGFCVDVEVSGYSYSSHSDRTFNCKVNLSKFQNSHWDYTDQPFLCLDAVEPEDLHWYIHHRGSRNNHLSYIRFFKQALKFIERERADEQDTRQRLAQALADGNIADLSERESIIGQAVIAWRAANRGKPLPRFEGGSAPAAWKSLLDQMYMLAGEGKRRISEVEDFVREIGLTPLRLVLSGGAKLVVYAAPRPEECDDRLERHAWVHRITVERGKTKYSEKSRRWASLPQQAASETTLHQWEGADDWASRASAFPSYERKAEVMAEAGLFAALLKPFTTTMSEGEHEVQFEDWHSVRRAILDNSKYVQNPSIAIPFGVVYYPRSKELRYLCVGVHKAHALLARLAPSDEAKGRVRAAFIKPFANKGHASSRFDEELSKEAWSLIGTTLALADNRRGVYVHSGIGIGVEEVHGKKHSPLLADWFDNWRESSKDHARVWVADGALDANGRLTLDALLGIELPEGYEPVRVREIKLSGSESLPKYHHWLDLCPGAQAPGEDGSFWSASRDNEIKQLVESVRPEGHSGYSSSHRVFLTRHDARAAIGEWVSAPHRAVPAAELPDAPKPPEGYERWFVVEGDAA